MEKRNTDKKSEPSSRIFWSESFGHMPCVAALDHLQVHRERSCINLQSRNAEQVGPSFQRDHSAHLPVWCQSVSPSDFQILDTTQETIFENPLHLVVYEATKTVKKTNEKRKHPLFSNYF